MNLRPYQLTALEALRAEMRQGRRRILLVSPTGSGKTEVARAMIQGASERGLRSLFLVHRRELVEQAWARLKPAGVIMAGWRPSGAPVLVASVQTLARRALPMADLVIVDEAHHSTSDSYRRILDGYPQARVIGLTASPWRLDGRGLGDIFETHVVAATPKQLIQEGHLCDYSGFRYLAPDLSGLHTRGGDYLPGGLSLAYKSSRIMADVVDRWTAHARGLRTILFAASIESSEDFAARFREAGVTAEHIDFKTPSGQRRAILDRVRSGETQMLCNVSLITEGVDVPELQCCILARPTKSLALYLQMVGRIMRPKKDGGKALILDHSENIHRHGLPDADRDYSLTTTKPKEPIPALRTCKLCFAIFEGPVCTNCGQTQPGAERGGPDEVDGAEVDIRADAGPSKSEMDAFKRELVSTAIAKGYKPGWVVRRWIEKYPHEPKCWGAFREVRAAQRGSDPT